MRRATVVLSLLAGALWSAAPVGAAQPTVERCLAQVNVQLFDATSTTQTDAITLVDMPASHTFKERQSRRWGVFAVPPAPGRPKTVAATGATTGHQYRFSLEWEMTAVERNNGSSRDKATITIRLTTPQGRLVAESVSRDVTVMSSDGQVRTSVRNRTRGLPLAAEFELSCTPVPQNPTEVFEQPGAGHVTYEVVSTASGPLTATPSGLAPDVPAGATVTQDPAQSFTPGGAGTTPVPFTILPGSAHFRVEMSLTDVLGALDLDLYLFRDGELVAESFNEGNFERIDVPDPPAGEYTMWVHGWLLFEGVTDASFTLHSWTVGGDTGTITVRAPSQLSAGATEYVTLFFTGLVPGTQYLGSIGYGGGVAGLPTQTLVNVVAL